MVASHSDVPASDYSVRLTIVPRQSGNVLLNIFRDIPELRERAQAEPLACANCGERFAARNALFKHLRTACLPAIATLDVPSEPPLRLALTVRYIGVRYHGFQRDAADVEKERPSVAGSIVTAARRAWGDIISTAAAPCAAARTEKGASAKFNLLVLTLHRGIGSLPDASALRRVLPSDVELLGLRVVAESAAGLPDAWHAVRWQQHAVLVPYSALLSPPGDETRSAGDDNDKGANSTAAPTTPAAPTSSTLRLLGLHDGCNAADVKALLCEAAGVDVDAIGSGCAVHLPACGGDGARIGPLPATALHCALDALDGLRWRGTRLQALREEEAATKCRVHERVESVLRELRRGTHFRNFVAAGSEKSSSGTQRRLQHAASSGLHGDVRPCIGDRGEVGSWREEDWCEIRFSAREFGAQQLRRMVGVIVAVVRGTEGAEYLQRCLASRRSVATPLAPAEATWLVSIGFDEAAAMGYLCEGGEGGGGESGGGKGCGGTNGDEDDLIKRAVLVEAAAAYCALVTALDGGDATRAVDDARLRSAAATGDAAGITALLEGGVARCDGRDEYGRSPLFLAAIGGHTEAVGLLLAAGARASQGANGGWMARAAASASRHEAIARQLEAASEGCPHAGAQPVFRKALARGGAGGSAPSPRLTLLLPFEADGHPGAGSCTIDDALTPAAVDAILTLWRSLPTAPKDKPSPIDRAYYADVDRAICALIDDALLRAGLMCVDPSAPSSSSAATQPLMRFLHYPEPGGSLPTHVDLPRLVDGVRTTHTFLLYLTDCESGGETRLLEARPGDAALASAGGVAPGERRVLAASAPRRGRLMMMPHACPHLAAPVESVPKILLRGEATLPCRAVS